MWLARWGETLRSSMIHSHPAQRRSLPLSTVRVGCDLVSIPDVERALQRHGERYVRRVYGEELFGVAGALRPESLAGRFAAMESVAKVLDARDSCLNIRDVRVGATVNGRPTVELGASGQQLARRQGIGWWDLSISHEGDFALAVAVATVTSSGSVMAGAEHMRSHGSGAPSPLNHHRKPPSSSQGKNVMDARNEIITALTEATRGSIAGDEVGDDASLPDHGLTSHQMVQWMLGIEEALDIEFEESQLNRKTFVSISSVQHEIERLL